MSNPLNSLLRTPPPDGPHYRWGYVTSVSPTLQVVLDTETDPIKRPSALVPLVPGDRVFVLMESLRATVLGRVPGDPGDPGDPTEVTEHVTNMADYASLQEAVNAAPSGGVVWVPEGIHGAGSQTTINKPLTITGPGTLLTTNSNAVLYITSNNVVVRGITISGPGTGGTRVDTSKLIHVEGSPSSRLEGIIIDGCTVIGAAHSAIYVEHVTNARVVNNYVRDSLYGGIMAFTWIGGVIANNIVENIVQKPPTVNTYGIALSDSLNTSAARSRNVAIVGNVVRDVPDWEGIDVHGAFNVSIVGNTVTGCRDGIVCVSGNESRIYSPEQVVIVGNVVNALGMSARAGIRLRGASTSQKGSGTISGNHVVGSFSVGEYDIDYGQLEPSRSSVDVTQGGSVLIGAVAPSSFSNVNVTFPRPYLNTPHVTANSDSARLYVAVRNVTTTGFNLEAYNSTTANSGTTTRLVWAAVPSR